MSHSRRLCRVLFVAVLVTLSALLRPAGALAADAKAQAELETAEQALVNLDYETANKGADRVIKHRGLTHEQLVRAYRVLALTNAVLDRESAAREAFQYLLVIDPDYQGDPNLGPKVQAPFMEARGFVRAQAVRPGIETSVNVRAGEAGTLRVTTRDPTHIVKKVAVGWRWGGESTFTTSTLGVGDAQVQVAAPPPGTSRLDYYAQALDDRDNPLFEAGNASLPKSTTIEAPMVARVGAGGGEPKEEGGTIFSSPVFWIVAGVVVVGAGVTTGVLLSSKDKTNQVQVPVTQPAAFLTPGLQCGQVKCN